MWMGACGMMNLGASPGQMSAIPIGTAVVGEVTIQILGAIDVGMLILLVFLICSEHCEGAKGYVRVCWQLRFSLCSGAVTTKALAMVVSLLLLPCSWLCGISYALCLLPRVLWSVPLLCPVTLLQLSLSSCVLLKGALPVQGFWTSAASFI